MLNLSRGERIGTCRRARLPADAVLLARDEPRLYSATDAHERELEPGKVHNLRVAAASTDGIVLVLSETSSIGAPRVAGRGAKDRFARGRTAVSSMAETMPRIRAVRNNLSTDSYLTNRLNGQLLHRSNANFYIVSESKLKITVASS
jgi:hypothetical protein